MSVNRWIHVIAAAAVLAATGIFVPHALAQASGQSPAAAPHWFVGLGGASMNPLHGDNEPEGDVLLASFGFTDNRRVRIESEVTRRARSTTYVNENVFLYGGPNGVHGHADRIDVGRETTDWTAGVNLIFRTGGRIVSLFGGPGVVLHWEQLREFRTVTNCTAPIPSAGAECGVFDNQSSSQGAGLQGIGGVDVAVHRRLTAFVAARGEYRKGLAMGGIGIMAGVRVGVR